MYVCAQMEPPHTLAKNLPSKDKQYTRAFFTLYSYMYYMHLYCHRHPCLAILQYILSVDFCRLMVYNCICLCQRMNPCQKNIQFQHKISIPLKSHSEIDINFFILASNQTYEYCTLWIFSYWVLMPMKTIDSGCKAQAMESRRIFTKSVPRSSLEI